MKAETEVTTTILLGILLLVLAVGTIIIYRQYQVVGQVRTTTAASSSTGKTLTAGGIAIPAASQARAQAAGYYCPSWDVKPGQASPDYCTALDR